jgi:hypothetical protein
MGERAGVRCGRGGSQESRRCAAAVEQGRRVHDAIGELGRPDRWADEREREANAWAARAMQVNGNGSWVRFAVPTR